jgi:hypothetical protein
MNSYRRLSWLWLVLVLTACQSAGAKKASLGEQFTLALGHSAVVEGQNVEVQFVRVLEDSRCPLGLTCVWGGQVRVRLVAADSELDLREGQSAVVKALRVTLLKVNPEPVASQKIPAERYRATLRVDPEQ